MLLYDDAGDHAGLQAAEMIAETGAQLEIVTPERIFAPEVDGMNLVPYMRSLQKRDVTFTVTCGSTRCAATATRSSPRSAATTAASRASGAVDQVVVDHGTRPLDELYFELKPRLDATSARSTTTALIAGRPQAVVRNPDGSFQLFRIGDAVAARNIHAAIYDALRLVRTL